MSTINGVPFKQAVMMCKTSDELADLVSDYKMSNSELDFYEERSNYLMDYEAMDLYKNDAQKKAEEFVERNHGRDNPEFDRLVSDQTKVEMDTEWSIRQNIDAAVKADTRQMERENDRQRELLEGLQELGDRVEESSAYAQAKKAAERHPFLTGLLGPSIVRKIFGP
jgi:hypothetical protein